MTRRIRGIHHVTAMAGDPQENVDFYTQVLGLRMVKRTVNFDDPGTYHLYYGDAVGRPGSIMTFFPWAHGRRGRRGVGQATVTSFAVPVQSISYWRDRLNRHGVDVEQIGERFGEEVLTLFDPHGLQIELVATNGGDEFTPWQSGPVPPRHSIRGFYGMTLLERSLEPTARLLTEVMGFEAVREEGDRMRLRIGDGGGAMLDVVALPAGDAGLVSVGTVHHVAWRVADEEEQNEWRGVLGDQGFRVTPIVDRNYFRSVYFHEPGGVLFELATDPPGFTVDEEAQDLGTRLMLPPWYEPHRAEIEGRLGELRVPVLDGRG